MISFRKALSAFTATDDWLIDAIVCASFVWMLACVAAFFMVIGQ